MMFFIIMATAPAAIIVASLALYFSVKCLIEIKALQNSTHQIEWMPVTPDSIKEGPSDTDLSNKFEDAGPVIKEEREEAIQENFEDL